MKNGKSETGGRTRPGILPDNSGIFLFRVYARSRHRYMIHETLTPHAERNSKLS